MKDSRGNVLFPVFIKLEELKLLIVGGGNIGLEKLEAVLNNSPYTDITLVGIKISEAIVQLAEQHSNLQLIGRAFEESDLDDKDMVILATNDNDLNASIVRLTRQRHLMTNVADKPDLCDFYLGSIVKKGDLKIAISTNGKSPTIAKRIKEDLNHAFPESIDTLLSRMNEIRSSIAGDFQKKVNTLNDVTKRWIADTKARQVSETNR